MDLNLGNIEYVFTKLIYFYLHSFNMFTEEKVLENTFFENIVNNQEPALLYNPYRNSYISEEDINKVTTTKGAFVSGDSKWYYYHTLDGRLVFVLNIGDNWSWQLCSLEDEKYEIPIGRWNNLWSLEDGGFVYKGEAQLMPTFLQRSCTQFDCHCNEQGLRECSTYNSCCKCYKEFDKCICK